jgi:hypothetical protein
MTKTQNKIIYNDYKIIKILIESIKHGNHEVIIDYDDFEKIKNYRWHLHAHHSGEFYCSTFINRKIHKMQHLLIKKQNSQQIDHINGNKLDNRKCNLRICTNKENAKNKKLNINNKTGYKGTHFDKDSGKYLAQIVCNYKRIYIGRYEKLIDAALAYNAAAIKYHGEFARLNEL